MQQLQHRTAMFTVYESASGIEVRKGCEDYNTSRVICTCLSYDRALETAEFSASIHSLPVINYVLTD